MSVKFTDGHRVEASCLVCKAFQLSNERDDWAEKHLEQYPAHMVYVADMYLTVGLWDGPGEAGHET